MTKANDYIGDHTGTSNYHKHHLSGLVYTDGVRDLAMNCMSFWLVDLITSHQINPKVKREEFQVWDLLRVTHNRFDVIASDGNKRTIASQQIEYSDFPYDSATIWVEGNVLLLPCEH